MPAHVDHAILVVDDDADDLEILKEVLSKFITRHRVESASNGEEALQKLNELLRQNELPCLVVLDINMPKLNGRETLQRIRQNEATKEVPVIMFSTADFSVEKRFCTMHKVQYVEKPFNYQKLFETVKVFLRTCDNARHESNDHHYYKD